MQDSERIADPVSAAVHDAAAKLAGQFSDGVAGVTSLVKAMKEFATSEDPRVAGAAAAVLGQFPPLVESLNEFLAASKEWTEKQQGDGVVE